MGGCVCPISFNCFAFNLFAALVQLAFYQIADKNSGGLVSKAVSCSN